MNFQLSSYTDILVMTKELKDKALAPIRAAKAKARLDTKMAELEEELLTAKTRVTEICSATDIDYDKLGDSLDDIALAERRINQMAEVKSQLFPV